MESQEHKNAIDGFVEIINSKELLTKIEGKEEYCGYGDGRRYDGANYTRVYREVEVPKYFKEDKVRAKIELSRIYRETKNKEERKKILNESKMSRLEIWEINNPKIAQTIYIGMTASSIAGIIYGIYRLLRR